MIQALLASPMVRKILGASLLLLGFAVTVRVQQAKISHWRSRAEQTERELYTERAINHQMADSLEHQNAAVDELRRQANVLDSRVRDAERTAEAKRRDSQRRADETMSQNVPDKTALQWLREQYENGRHE